MSKTSPPLLAIIDPSVMYVNLFIFSVTLLFSRRKNLLVLNEVYLSIYFVSSANVTFSILFGSEIPFPNDLFFFISPTSYPNTSDVLDWLMKQYTSRSFVFESRFSNCVLIFLIKAEVFALQLTLAPYTELNSPILTSINSCLFVAYVPADFGSLGYVLLSF